MKKIVSYSYIPLKILEQNLKSDAKNKNGEVIQINMDGAIGKELVPGKLKNIFTHDLCGCSSSFILARCKNGNPFAIMTHFPPDYASVHRQEISRLLRQNERFIDTSKAVTFLFLAPEQSINKISTNTYDSGDDKLFNEIHKTLSNFFKDKINVKPLFYNSKGDSRVFIVNLPSQKGEKITYKAVGNNRGTVGIM
ncbi:MAG: hypothetical protein WCG23_05930 [bacterium]